MDEITAQELATRLGDDDLVVLDVRSLAEYTGALGAPCDPRQGHVPGARHVEVTTLIEAHDAVAVRELVGAPAGAEVVAYCHSGQRSALAVEILLGAGYTARNYRGSWHEWSSDDSLPVDLG